MKNHKKSNQTNKTIKLSPLLGIYTRVETPFALVAVLIKSIVYDIKTKDPEMIMGESFIIVMN